MICDLLTVLYAHPQVRRRWDHRPQSTASRVYRYLQAIAADGFTNRVMFGSDQMVWAGTIERAIAVIEKAPFLSKQQKRDIFYNNAAHFPHLSKEVIVRHPLF